MKLMIALGIDTQEYEDGLKKSEGKAASSAQKIGAAFSSVGAKMQDVGGKMTAGITLPIVALGGVAVNAASDLNETMSKVQVVFGESSERVLAFGDNAATALGMSKNAALSTAGTYGNLFVSMGLGADKSADMSMGLVQLASDLASFNNMDPTEVMEKLRAGLTGETEPLKSLGVNLNEATVKAKAMEMGLWDGTGAIDAAAKAQATLAMVVSQTATAHGDFARTADGLANSTRIAKAQLEDAAAKMGAQLLPVALQLVGGISKLVGWFTNLSPATQKTILIVAGLAAAIGPVVGVIGTLMTVIGAVTTFLAGPTIAAVGSVIAAMLPVIGIVLAVVAVVALVYFAWKNNWGGIQGIVAGVGKAIAAWYQQTVANFQAFIGWVVMVASRVATGWNAMVAIIRVLPRAIQQYLTNAFQGAARGVLTWLNNIIGSVKKFVDQVTGFFAGLWSAILGGVKAAWNNIVSAVRGAIDDVFGAITKRMDELDPTWRADWEKIKGALKEKWDNMIQAVKDAWENIKSAIGRAITDVYNSLISWASKVIAAVQSWWDGVQSAVGAAWTGIVAAIAGAIAGVVTAVRNFAAPIIAAVSSWWDGVKAGVSAAWTGIVSTVTGAIGSVVTAVQNFAAPILAAVSSWWDGVKASVAAAWADITAAIGKAIDTAMGAVKGVKDKFVQIGKDLIQGIIDGFNAMLEALKTAAAKVVLAILDKLKALLGIGTSSATSFSVNSLQTIQAVTPPGVGGSGGRGPSAGPINNTFNIFAKETPGQIQQALTLSGLMGGAA